MCQEEPGAWQLLLVELAYKTGVERVKSLM